MVNARSSHGNAHGLFISLEGWRTLAGGNTPGHLLFVLRPERSPECILGYPIRPTHRIRPIPSRPKSTFAHSKSTFDLGRELLIKVENYLISPLPPTSYKPLIKPQNMGIEPKSNLYRPKRFVPPLIKSKKISSTPDASILNPAKPYYTPLNPAKHPHPPADGFGGLHHQSLFGTIFPFKGIQSSSKVFKACYLHHFFMRQLKIPCFLPYLTHHEIRNTCSCVKIPSTYNPTIP
jgi:hypothetical protein